MKIACLRIVLRHVPVLQLHVHVQAQVMIRLETIFRDVKADSAGTIVWL